MILNSNQIHFKNEYLGKPSWACLSHRSLEDGTRVQQIIIGYFVAPISEVFCKKFLSMVKIHSKNQFKNQTFVP